MVEVINTIPDKDVKKQIVCRNCGVTLEYLPFEVKEYHGTDIGGGPDGQKWVDCPNCGKKAVTDSW